MKNTVLFKTLIDILFYLHAFALPGLIVLVPLGAADISKINFNIESWSLLYWCLLIVSLIVFIAFLRGLYFLRIVARFLLSKKYFTDRFILNIKKSGIHFLIAGVLDFTLLIGVWIFNLYNGKVEFEFSMSTITPLFITIIGLFFIIQSKTFMLAKGFKEENELTV